MSDAHRPQAAIAPGSPAQLRHSSLNRQPLTHPSGPEGTRLNAKLLEGSKFAQYSYQAHITGAVLFDSNGLPREYFTTTQLSLENWEQLIFQLLGLRWLLMSSLNFDSFNFARASSGHHTAVLLRQRESYVALLTENLRSKIYDIEFRQWLSTFDLTLLRHDGRFQSF